MAVAGGAAGGAEGAAAATSPAAQIILAELGKGMSRILGAGDDTVKSFFRALPEPGGSRTR